MASPATLAPVTTTTTTTTSIASATRFNATAEPSGLFGPDAGLAAMGLVIGAFAFVAFLVLGIKLARERLCRRGEVECVVGAASAGGGV